MSHRNSVTLTGPFWVEQARIVHKHEVDILEVVGKVRTGPPDLGGVHRVLIYGRDARLVSAFVEANGGDGMEVTVYGRLFSGEAGAEIYVERLTFHVSSEVAEKARAILQGAGRAVHPERRALARDELGWVERERGGATAK